MSDTRPIIRCFCVPATEPVHPGDVIAYACDEDGKTLSSHYCSSPGWAEHDIMGESHHDDYYARHPEGFELQWIRNYPTDWDGGDWEGPPNATSDASDTPETEPYRGRWGIWVLRGHRSIFEHAQKLERERNALANRLKRAEDILSRLADGYPVSVLDDATPGEQMGQRVLEYWRWVEREGSNHG